MAEPGGRVVARPRIRRRLRVIAVGLVLLPTLALLFLVRAVLESDQDARLREQQERQQALERRVTDLASRLGDQQELFPPETREYFWLLEAAPAIELSRPPLVDGSCSDWAATDRRDTNPCETGLLDFHGAAFSLLTGTRERELYLFLRVFDDELRFRERHLDEGDQLHLVASLPGPDGASVPLRFLVALEPGPDGGVTTYQVERSWGQQVRSEARLDWGNYQLSPSRRPHGRWRGTPQGYEIELRLPLASLGARWREADLGLAVVDVDQRTGTPRGLHRRALWVVPQREGAFVPEAPDARAFRRAWREAKRNDRQRSLAVFDARGRELYASYTPGREARERVLEILSVLGRGDSLASEPAAAGLAAARVVSRDDRVLGLVIEEDTTPGSIPRLGAMVSESPMTAAILASALVLLFLLLAYTRRLSRRILALVDDVGGDRDADDEIGELSRRLSDLIERDRAHRDYLEQLPRVLAHETSNPLGVVKMFMEDLADTDPTEQKRRHDSARRAIHSIEDLIEDLREATSLEEALERGERIEVDLVEHLAEYASAYRDLNRVALELSLPAGGFRTRVIEGRIEQLLDKLLDNAVDFSDGSPVQITVEIRQSEARIRVENSGPPLPEGPATEQLFAPMRSGRKRTRERHLGLGLYVARVIAEHHGGGIRAWNADGGRVVFEVTLRRFTSA